MMASKHSHREALMYHRKSISVLSAKEWDTKDDKGNVCLYILQYAKV